jgi:hypothetical protein
MFEPGLVAPLAEFVSKASVRERPFELVHKVSYVSTRRGINDALKRWQDRQRVLPSACDCAPYVA